MIPEEALKEKTSEKIAAPFHLGMIPDDSGLDAAKKATRSLEKTSSPESVLNNIAAGGEDEEEIIANQREKYGEHLEGMANTQAALDKLLEQLEKSGYVTKSNAQDVIATMLIMGRDRQAMRFVGNVFPDMSSEQRAKLFYDATKDASNRLWRRRDVPKATLFVSEISDPVMRAECFGQMSAALALDDSVPESQYQKIRSIVADTLRELENVPDCEKQKTRLKEFQKLISNDGVFPLLRVRQKEPEVSEEEIDRQAEIARTRQDKTTALLSVVTINNLGGEKGRKLLLEALAQKEKAGGSGMLYEFLAKAFARIGDIETALSVVSKIDYDTFKQKVLIDILTAQEQYTIPYYERNAVHEKVIERMAFEEDDPKKLRQAGFRGDILPTDERLTPIQAMYIELGRAEDIKSKQAIISATETQRIRERLASKLPSQKGELDRTQDEWERNALIDTELTVLLGQLEFEKIAQDPQPQTNELLARAADILVDWNLNENQTWYLINGLIAGDYWEESIGGALKDELANAAYVPDEAFFETHESERHHYAPEKVAERIKHMKDRQQRVIEKLCRYFLSSHPEKREGQTSELAGMVDHRLTLPIYQAAQSAETYGIQKHFEERGQKEWTEEEAWQVDPDWEQGVLDRFGDELSQNLVE